MDNCDKLLTPPVARSNFSRIGEGWYFLSKNKPFNEASKTITTPLHYQRTSSHETYLLIGFLSKINVMTPAVIKRMKQDGLLADLFACLPVVEMFVSRRQLLLAD